MWTEHDLPWLAAPLARLRQARGHALIVHGGAGCGLLELGVRAAQAWLCEQDGAAAEPPPCGVCPSCRLSLAGSHPDLRVVLPEALQPLLPWALNMGEEGGSLPPGDAADDAAGKGKRKPSKEIRIDAVRAAIDWAHTSSGRGRGKVLLIHRAEAMNAVSANALLKTLEEPAPGMRVLLCAQDPERLLPTIRSRCQQIRLAPPDAAAALAWLSNQGQAQPELLLMAAGGEPLAARQLAGQLAALNLDADAWAALPRQVARGQTGWLPGWPLPDVVRMMQQICHDAMAQAAGAVPRFFPPQALPPRADWAALADWSRDLSRWAAQAGHPWHVPLLLDALLARARQVWDISHCARGGSHATGREIATLAL